MQARRCAFCPVTRLFVESVRAAPAVVSRRTTGRKPAATGPAAVEPAPAPRRTLMVFCLGGVTPSELRRIQELRGGFPDTQVVVGATTLLPPSRFVNDLRYLGAAE